MTETRDVATTLQVQFGFTDQANDPALVRHSPLSRGYIGVSQQDSGGAVVSARHEIFWLVMDLPELLSGLSAFLRNRRTKHYSFTSSDMTCLLQFDRRKRAMLCLQINETAMLRPEAAILTAFQQGVTRFYEGEYATVDLNYVVAGDRIETERALDQEFRRCCEEFLTIPNTR
ncbi:MAG: hypothetical protein JWL77_4519 [Chthonomonadaceae bacterium]|nr:hypothetical protein [Chthonomonadaceae bacterium]